MKEVKGWIGSELLHGTVYGLGMSAIVWISLNSGVLSDGRWGLVCLAGGLAGISRGWAGWPAPAALPWILAAWQLEGLGAAMLLGTIAVLASGTVTRARNLGGKLSFDAGSTALAVLAADGIALWLDGSIQPAIAFAAGFVLIQLALHGLRRGLTETSAPRILRNAAASVVILAGSVALAWAIVSIWAWPGYRVWLALVPALRVGGMLGAAATRWRIRAPRSRQSRAPDRLRDRTAAALAQALPEGAPGGHLWRTQALCIALAERLGSDPDEIRLLSQAALLHHVGQLAFEDTAVEVHPRVVEKTVEQLGFAPEVCSMLAHSRECWNGDGPRGLRGERICRGARILAVADRYDQLAHGRSGAGGHSMTTALLRNESNGRYDPLMFEILDELSERLESTGADLTRSPGATETPGNARLVDGESDLQVLYSIEQATRLPIGLRERLTLIAGLLRSSVPFSHLRVEHAGGEAFCYGARESDGEEHTTALQDGDKRVGLLRLAGGTWDAPRIERVDRIAAIIARMIAGETRVRARECLTDPETGLPNARFLRRTLAQRIPGNGHAGPGFGLIVLHVRGLAALAERRGPSWAKRYLNTVARRIAVACDECEIAVRLGPDQFIVLTGESRGGELVRRWHELRDSVSATAVESADCRETIRLDAAHAAHPLDGSDLEMLLRTLEARLAGPHGTRVVPFPRRHAG